MQNCGEEDCNGPDGLPRSIQRLEASVIQNCREKDYNGPEGLPGSIQILKESGVQNFGEEDIQKADIKRFVEIEQKTM